MDSSIERDDRPAYRPFRVRLVRQRDLSPRFVRLTFTGPELDGFGRDGLDQRIKLVLPHPDADALLGSPDWYATWRALPTERRPPFRTFTVRAVRAEQRELDIDFALHTPEAGAELGPAAAWVAVARPGDELVVIGPDARSRNSATGIDWHPGDAEHLLLAGDETAVPAIAGILATLPSDRRATVLIETPTTGDAVALPSTARTDIRWLARRPGQAGDALLAAVRAWVAEHTELVTANRSPERQVLEEIDVDTTLLWESADAGSAGLYAWLAGEAAVIKSLRRVLVSEAGINRHQVAFMGYWRRGRAEAT